MSDKKISQLTGASAPLAGTEELPIVQSGVTKKVTVDNLTTGKAVAGLSFTGGNLKTSPAAANLDISGTTILASGSDANVDVNVTAKGSGNVNVSAVGLQLVNATNKAVRIDTATSNAAFYSGWQDNAFVAVNRNPVTGTFTDASKAAAVIGLNSSDGSSSIIFRTTTTNNVLPAETMEIASNGNVIVKTNNLVIGTAGKGIDFSADGQAAGMTSELLDDYEEGTFTPTIVGTTTAGTGTYVTQIGRYAKVGQVVTIDIVVEISAHTGTGNMRIAGLPFTSVNDGTIAILSGVPVNLALTAGFIAYFNVTTGATTINLGQMRTGGGASTLVPMDTACYLAVSGSYRT